MINQMRDLGLKHIIQSELRVKMIDLIDNSLSKLNGVLKVNHFNIIRDLSSELFDYFKWTHDNVIRSFDPHEN